MNKIFKGIKYIFTNPSKIYLELLMRCAPIIPDKIFLKWLFRLKIGHPLDLSNPKSYNEKLQWLKLYNRRPEYIDMVDKAAAKDYVANIIGKEHIISTISIWESVDDIDFEKLPNQFVLKCTHDSGGVVICKDKSQLDIEQTKLRLRQGLKRNFYNYNREWPYKGVKPRIIGEEYMVDESGYELKDYKFFCFDGVPKALFIASDRGSVDEETKFDFFDMEFRHLPFTNGHPNSNYPINKPEGFEKMKELAAKLSEGIPHVRVDLYNINGKIYFGELTFFHWSGIVPFVPEEWDYTFGSWIKLPCRD